jgi:hypothetical protein
MSDEPASKKEVELPMMSFVRGGTTSAGHDALIAKSDFEARQRQSQYDDMTQASADAGDMSRQYTNKLGGFSSHASIVLALRNKKDNTIDTYLMCEITDQGDHLELNMICPHCAATPGASWRSQFKVSQQNRGWSLDTRMASQRKPNPLVPASHGWVAGDIWSNPEPPHEVLTIAGTVTTHGPIKCPTCGWTFDIEDSIVRTR